jgi:hypothetical protein
MSSLNIFSRTRKAKEKVEGRQQSSNNNNINNSTTTIDDDYLAGEVWLAYCLI